MTSSRSVLPVDLNMRTLTAATLILFSTVVTATAKSGDQEYCQRLVSEFESIEEQFRDLRHSSEWLQIRYGVDDSPFEPPSARTRHIKAEQDRQDSLSTELLMQRSEVRRKISEIPFVNAKILYLNDSILSSSHEPPQRQKKVCEPLN